MPSEAKVEEAAQRDLQVKLAKVVVGIEAVRKKIMDAGEALCVMPAIDEEFSSQDLDDALAWLADAQGDGVVVNEENQALWLDCPDKIAHCFEGPAPGQAPANAAPKAKEAPVELKSDVVETSSGVKPEVVPPVETDLDDEPRPSKAELEADVHELRKVYIEATMERDRRHSAYKAAKDAADEALADLLMAVNQLDDLNHPDEFTEKRLKEPHRDDAPGQKKLPLTISDKPVTSGDNSGVDAAAGFPIGCLEVSQLKEKTNGVSVGADGKSAGISQSTADMLMDRGFPTVGQLEAHMRTNGEFWAKEIKGVGPAKADLIAEAIAVLRRVFPQSEAADLEELILDEAAYQMGVAARRGGGPRALINGWSATGHQGRSWLKGYDDQAKTEELTAGAEPAHREQGKT